MYVQKIQSACWDHLCIKRAPTVALDLGYNSFDVAKKLSGLNVLAGGDDFMQFAFWKH